MKKIIFYFIFTISSLIACNENYSDYQVLKTFLYKNYSISINKKERYFIFIPNNQCKNCININSVQLSNITLENVIIISSLPKKYFGKFHHYIYDPENKMFNLKFINYSNTLILIKNKNIVDVKNNIDIDFELLKINNIYTPQIP